MFDMLYNQPTSKSMNYLVLIFTHYEWLECWQIVRKARGSVPGRVIQKAQKMELDAALLNTQHYKIQIKSKWSNPGKGYHCPLHFIEVDIEKEAFGLTSTKASQHLFMSCLFCFVLRHINLIGHLMPNQVKENKSGKEIQRRGLRN